jgi:hypothetical protein
MQVITRQTVVEKIEAYLRHEISLPQMVDWAERAVMDGDFSESDAAALTRTVARLGVADVRRFGLTWEDFLNLLRDLGYSAKIELVPTP